VGKVVNGHEKREALSVEHVNYAFVCRIVEAFPRKIFLCAARLCLIKADKMLELVWICLSLWSTFFWKRVFLESLRILSALHCVINKVIMSLLIFMEEATKNFVIFEETADCKSIN